MYYAYELHWQFVWTSREHISFLAKILLECTSIMLRNFCCQYSHAWSMSITIIGSKLVASSNSQTLKKSAKEYLQIGLEVLGPQSLTVFHLIVTEIPLWSELDSSGRTEQSRSCWGLYSRTKSIKVALPFVETCVGFEHGNVCRRLVECRRVCFVHRKACRKLVEVQRIRFDHGNTAMHVSGV